MGLIDSKDLIEEINRLIEEVNKTGVNLGERTAYFSCLTAIDKLSSEKSIAPRQRARVVPAPALPKPQYFCPLCKASLEEEFNYCPTCGAELIKGE